MPGREMMGSFSIPTVSQLLDMAELVADKDVAFSSIYQNREKQSVIGNLPQLRGLPSNFATYPHKTRIISVDIYAPTVDISSSLPIDGF